MNKSTFDKPSRVNYTTTEEAEKGLKELDKIYASMKLDTPKKHVLMNEGHEILGELILSDKKIANKVKELIQK
jgi:hypothetical protein